MKEVANNQFYELSYDEKKNWVYWTMRGFWKSMAVAPNFDKDWDSIQALTKPGFRIFADLSKLKLMPDDVMEAQNVRQAKLMEGGCKRVSVLMENEVTKLSLNDALEKNKMHEIVRYFLVSESKDAEKFLEKE
ncbi:MAG: hypothetical protein HQK49_04885 [Oligoflexia bacterium]|nr:hypothetical protein [Oligoflexia bacterium]